MKIGRWGERARWGKEKDTTEKIERIGTVKTKTRKIGEQRGANKTKEDSKSG
jgi:hypothetical protein